MARLVLVAHAPLAAAWQACAEHVLGHVPDLEIVDIPADVDPEQARRQLLTHWQDDARAQDGILVLCDLYGATPFNIASWAVQQLRGAGQPAVLLTGANLCMVLKALTTQGADVYQLADRVRLSGLNGVVDASDRIVTAGTTPP